MSNKPVVVYGASGYTGRLICEYLREYNVPFTAAGRDEGKLTASMEKNVAGIETADYEVREVETGIASASPHALIIMLYDGALVALLSYALRYQLARGYVLVALPLGIVAAQAVGLTVVGGVVLQLTVPAAAALGGVLVPLTLERFGRLDAVVANAGVLVRRPLRRMELDDWRRVIDTNLTSAMLASRAAHPHLKRGGRGRVINTCPRTAFFWRERAYIT